MNAIPNFRSFLDEETIVIAMAKLLDSSSATRLDSHRKRLAIYLERGGIAPAISTGLDRRAVVYANIRRKMDERDLIGEMEDAG